MHHARFALPTLLLVMVSGCASERVIDESPSRVAELLPAVAAKGGVRDLDVDSKAGTFDGHRGGSFNAFDLRGRFSPVDQGRKTRVSVKIAKGFLAHMGEGSQLPPTSTMEKGFLNLLEYGLKHPPTTRREVGPLP